MIINEKFYAVMMLVDWWKYSNFAELLKISILKTNINVSLITDSHISIDGRYRGKVEILENYYSEYALIAIA